MAIEEFYASEMFYFADGFGYRMKGTSLHDADDILSRNEHLF